MRKSFLAIFAPLALATVAAAVAFAAPVPLYAVRPAAIWPADGPPLSLAAEMAGVFGISELIVAKQRHGSTGKVKLRFEAQITRFSDYIDEAFSPERRG